MTSHTAFDFVPRVADGHLRIEVGGGFDPQTIVTRAGHPLRLTFHRRETWPCSGRVVFPDFGVDVALGPHEDVVVEITPEAGDYEFTCGMGMLKGRLIVEPA